jgi:hypothetical protein
MLIGYWLMDDKHMYTLLIKINKNEYNDIPFFFKNNNEYNEFLQIFNFLFIYNNNE